MFYLVRLRPLMFVSDHQEVATVESLLAHASERVFYSNGRTAPERSRAHLWLIHP
jgi:hypothetical protein